MLHKFKATIVAATIAQQQLRTFYLIDIFTLDTIARVSCWALSTLPGTIGKTGALGTIEAGVGQATI